MMVHFGRNFLSYFISSGYLDWILLMSCTVSAWVTSKLRHVEAILQLFVLTSWVMASWATKTSWTSCTPTKASSWWTEQITLHFLLTGFLYRLWLHPIWLQKSLTATWTVLLIKAKQKYFYFCSIWRIDYIFHSILFLNGKTFTK